MVGPNVSCALAGHGLLYVKERQASGGYVRAVTVFDARVTGPVARLLWLREGRELGTDESVRRTCDAADCVATAHHAALPRGASLLEIARLLIGRDR